MNIRKISILLAVLVLAGGIFLFRYLRNQKKAPQLKEQSKVQPAVEVIPARKQAIQLKVPFTGRLEPSEKIDLIAEVTGVLESSARPFKNGSYFRKGQLLMAINSSEEQESLRASKSGLLTSLTSLLPDMKLDYPQAFPKWKAYVDSFQMEKRVRPLPKIEDERVGYFITNRNVLNQYYSIKQSEERLSKYRIYAPFSGVLAETSINRGALVRAGQKVASFFSSDRYELAATVDVGDLKGIGIGDTAYAYFSAIHDTLMGRVIRKSAQVDPNTQSITIYLAFQDKALYDGLFGEGDIQSKTLKEAFLLPRSSLMDDTSVYVVEDSLLKRKQVRLLRYMGSQAVVRGLKEGQQVMSRVLPDVYEGMPALPRLKNQPTESQKNKAQ